MESAANLINNKLNILRQKGVIFRTAVMVGGPSNSPIWPQITEEITGIIISVGSQYAGAKGAATLARGRAK